MKTEKLRMALILLRNYAIVTSQSEAEYRTNTELANDAQQELSGLTELVDVVKGFIECQGITCDEDVYQSSENSMSNPLDFIVDCCNIVGYKE